MKENFGLDGSNADFMVIEGKVVPGDLGALFYCENCHILLAFKIGELYQI